MFINPKLSYDKKTKQTPLETISDVNGAIVQTFDNAKFYVAICKNEKFTANETVKLLFLNFTKIETDSLVNLIRYFYK